MHPEHSTSHCTTDSEHITLSTESTLHWAQRAHYTEHSEHITLSTESTLCTVLYTAPGHPLETSAHKAPRAALLAQGPAPLRGNPGCSVTASSADTHRPSEHWEVNTNNFPCPRKPRPRSSVISSSADCQRPVEHDANVIICLILGNHGNGKSLAYSLFISIWLSLWIHKYSIRWIHTNITIVVRQCAVNYRSVYMTSQASAAMNSEYQLIPPALCPSCHLHNVQF